MYTDRTCDIEDKSRLQQIQYNDKFYHDMYKLYDKSFYFIFYILAKGDNFILHEWNACHVYLPYINIS